MWWLLLGAAVVIFYYYLREKSRHFEKLGVPHVKPWFIIGNMGPVFLRRKSFPDLVLDYYRQFKGERYFGFYNFTTPMIIVRDPEIIKDVGIKYFDNFVDRLPFMHDEADRVLSKNLVILRGDKWRESRAILSPAFTGSKMRGMFNLVNSTADNFNNCLVSNSNLDNDIDMKDVFGRYTTDVIANAAFGIEVNSLLNENNDFYKIGKETSNFNGWKTIAFFLNKMIPSVVKLFNLSMFSRKIEKFFYDLVKSNVEERERHNINRRDMLQLMIQSNNESKTTKLTLEDMTGEAFLFFFAGFESTSSSICFAAHEIANNPLVQRKLAQEVRQNYDKIMDRDNGYDDVRGLSYLDAVVRETLRIHAPGFLMDRTCTEPFKLPPLHPGANEIMVHRGDAIGFPFQAIHLDPQYYPEPEKFIPERFLKEDGTISRETIDSGTYLPFGLGPRICIGIRFALMELKLVLIHLLARCELFPSTKTAYPVKYSKVSSQLAAENGFWLKLKMHEKGDYYVK